MTIRAKFQCNSVTLMLSSRYSSETGRYEPTTSKTWKFSAVVGGSGSSEENQRFFASTPSGTIELYCVNPDVEFELGKDYYLDFTLAE